MNRKPYSSAIKKTPFKYPIAKKIAKLMLDGKEYSEIYEECYTNNYIEIESPDRRREITNVIYGRLSALDPYLLSEFYNGDVATSKFILAYSIAKTDTLMPHLLVMDSPILSLKEREEDKGTEIASDSMRGELFQYMIDHEKNRQTIILENEIPPLDYSTANTIHFTRTIGTGRFGLIEGYRD